MWGFLQRNTGINCQNNCQYYTSPLKSCCVILPYKKTFTMKRSIISTFLLIPLLVCCNTKKEKLSDEPNYIADFEIFQSIFEKANSGLYKYHSKKSIDSAFLVNKNRITDQTSYREFYNLLWNVIDYTGSCHNSLAYPDSLDKALNKKKIFFPLPLKFLNNRLYSNSNYRSIPLGSEIISINGIPATTFVQNTSRYLSTDGHNTTGKRAFMETDWLPFYAYLAYGEQKTFSISYKTNTYSKQILLEAVDYKAFKLNYKQRFVPTYPSQVTEDYAFRYINPKTGLLTVNTFALGGPKSKGHKKYSTFLDSVFKDLKTKKIKNIIVDVRQNGGGNDPNDLLLYSYLTQRDFRENKSAFAIFNEIPLKQYYFEEEPDEIKDLEKELKEENNILREGKYFLDPKFNPVWHSNKNTFTGKIYLLVSPFVASAGSLFASMVKSDAASVVIGQETLGGYYGHTGHTPVTYRLPNTSLLLTFSIIDLKQDVQNLPDQKPGDGIIPNHLVSQTIEQYLNAYDAELEFAKKLTR